MTTATRRLRRASVAGLATIATAAAVVASAGSALAFTGATGVLAGGSGTAVVFPGQSAQALSDVTLALNNTSWVSGDFLTFELSSTTPAATAICQTTSNLAKGASFSAAPTDTAVDSGGATVAAAAITLGSSGTCNVNDKFTFALPAPPSDTGTTTFTITGLKLSLGTAIAGGTVVYLSANASNGAPFVGPLANAAVQEATVGTNSVTASPVVGAANGSSGVAISPIVATDVTGNTLKVNLIYTLAGGDKFATAGTLTAPSGVTITGPTETVPSATLTYTIAAGTVPAGGKFTLTGATVNFAATGSRKVIVTSNAVAVGSATGTEFAVTAAEVRTFAGVDRYGTARALYHAAFAARTVAVITSGANYPDALSADVIAKKNTTGVLLTTPNALSQDAQQELQADPIATVYIIGGIAAVSQNVQNAIAALHVQNTSANPLINVVRLAGADRYATNNTVNLTAGPTGGRAIIATGANFADALAVGPVVYDQNYALVLTDPSTLSASASSTLTNLGISHVVIVGGTSAVSANVETQLKAAGITIDYRIAGADRTATAAMIATWATAGLPASGSYSALAGTFAGWVAARSTALLTRGDTFADALAAGPVAGLAKEVLVLTANPSTLGAGAATYLGGLAGTVTTISTLGFAAAVTPATVNAAVAALG